MVYCKNYSLSLQEGFDHLDSHTQGEALLTLEKGINYLETNQGSRKGCLLVLRKLPASKAMLAYFRNHDIESMKQWAYVAAKIIVMLEHEEPGGLSVENFLWPLLSDNLELIIWFAQHGLFSESASKSRTVNSVNSGEYYGLQIMRALNGQWDALGEACELALSQPDAFKRLMPRFRIYQFLLGLAKGDKAEMARVLYERCSPKFRRRSFEYESPFTNHFIVSYATLFAKLASYHGYELDLDTPWIPQEWLPVTPLAHYEDPWPFMQRFDIWQPFADPWTQWSPQKPSQGN